MLRVERLRDQEGDGRGVLGLGSEVEGPDVEVLERPVRRRFTTEYKRRIVREADVCGEVGALLRREALYSSHLSAWRKQYREGALCDKRRGRRAMPSKGLRKRITQLEKENARLRRQLEEARVIVEFQKKACEIMGIPLKSPESDERE
jgi:transposase